MNFHQSEYIKCAAEPIYYINKYGYTFDASKNIVAPMKCFEYQEDCLTKFHKHRNNIILKSRQCLPKNTFVDTPRGPVAIQDFQVGDELYSYNIKTSSVELDVVCDAWKSGERQCVKFKLQDSRNFEIGENHPFYVKNKGWVKSKDLQIGDEILDSEFEFGDISANEDEIKILSYLITDGCTNKQIKFTNNNKVYLDEFEESLNRLFPDIQIRKSKKNNGFDYYPHQKHGTRIKNPVMQWCEKNNIANKKTEFKILPDSVFSWDKKSISLLINRMFAGDGWISIPKSKKNEKRIEIGIASPSEKFLNQIKFLLKKFGIKCNIYEIRNMKLQKNKFFKLRISHSKSVIKFVKEIGILDKVKKEHHDVCDSYKHNVKDFSIIKKIEKTTIKECYDISVKNNENFFVNGLLTHNTGLSVITAGYVAWRLMFRRDERILIIANDGAGAIRFLKTVKQFIEYTPQWLKPSGAPVWNQKKIEFSNGSWAEAKASSPEAGRGESLTMLVLDETAFIEHAEAIWMAAGMALSATKGKCIMISTPKGQGNLYHKTWVSQEKGEGDFIGTKVHWTQNPHAASEMQKRVDDFGFEYIWSPWYQEQCERLHWDKVKIAQELDLSFEGSKRLAIESELIEKYKKRVEGVQPIAYIDYKFNEVSSFTAEEALRLGSFAAEYKTRFYVYKMPDKNSKYILSSDVARGDGGDYSTIQILDAVSLEQVAEWQGKISPDLLACIIYYAAHLYNKAFVVIEANSFGLTTCLDLQKKFKYDNMYMSKNIKDIYVRPYDFKISEGDSIPGIQTTKKTRPLFMSTLMRYMREGQVKINSSRLLSEFSTFVMNGDKAEHEPGFNDDLIFALSFALYVRDTEFESILTSKELSKNLLDGFIVSNKYGAPSKPSQNSNVDANSFFINTSLNNSEAMDNDDSWLFR